MLNLWREIKRKVVKFLQMNLPVQFDYYIQRNLQILNINSLKVIQVNSCTSSVHCCSVHKTKDLWQSCKFLSKKKKERSNPDLWWSMVMDVRMYVNWPWLQPFSVNVCSWFNKKLVAGAQRMGRSLWRRPRIIGWWERSRITASSLWSSIKRMPIS